MAALLKEKANAGFVEHKFEWVKKKEVAEPVRVVKKIPREIKVKDLLKDLMEEFVDASGVIKSNGEVQFVLLQRLWQQKPLDAAYCAVFP